MSFTAPRLPDDLRVEAAVRLGKIEAQENVTIVFAVESGSRAWGFPSPDSDNDVRFFYVRPVPEYLGLVTPKDTIERPIDGDWDLSGWDLGKALRLLVKGNATVAEWLSSPLIYREHGPFPARLRHLIKRNASPEASARHYWGLTKQCYDGSIALGITKDDYDDRRKYGSMGVKFNPPCDIPLKKYLYAARGATAISWIRSYQEIPPMTLPALLSLPVMPEDARAELDKLLAHKAITGELGKGPRIPALDAFIEEQMAWVQENKMTRLPDNAEFRAEANKLLLEALGVA
jgi:predicted nucleotidyltransferase